MLFFFVLRSPMHYLIIGALTRDIHPNGWTQGGTGTFASRALAGWDAQITIISPLDPFMQIELPPQCRLIRLPSMETATFQNTYQGDARQQWIHAVPDPIHWSAISTWTRSADIVHLAPLAGEMTNLPPRAMFDSAFIGLTAQGLLRTWNADGRIHAQAWQPTKHELNQIDAIVVSEEDVAGDEMLVQHWADSGVIAALTRGSRGATVWHNGTRYNLNAVPTDVRDPTGAGDVWAAAFFWQLKHGADVQSAGAWACEQAARRIGRVRLEAEG